MTSLPSISSLLQFARVLPLTAIVYMSGIAQVKAIDSLQPRNGGSGWVNARIGQNTANYTQIITTGSANPLGRNSYLQWDRFDLASGQHVEFLQPGANHIALNRIYGGQSQIDGRITGNGRIYLLNNNGFLFGPNSSINVQSLIASSLNFNVDLDDPDRLNAFVNNELPLSRFIAEGAAAFSGGAVGDIRILPGAQIETKDGGNVFVFAPDISNAGTIKTPGGQTILAASNDTVYLTPSLDPALRGFLVEVGSGGNVINTAEGEISAERGNITLAGLAINQDGYLEATTSINENGSIRLLARDGAHVAAIDSSNLKNSIRNDSIPVDIASELILGVDLNEFRNADGSVITEGNVAVAENTGTVTLGENSRIQISADHSDDIRAERDPEFTGNLASDQQQQQVSRVEITGNKITLENNAEIVAEGGQVILHATESASQTALDISDTTASVTPLRTRSAGSDTQIVMQQGSRIDVSGNTEAEVAMERNQLEVQLTGNFLRDAPLQREGELRNERVMVDIRRGTELGDIQPLVESEIKRNVDERLSVGGDVQIISQGVVDLRQGSVVDISGGQVKYESGYVTTSQLVTDTGRVVDISDANRDQDYLGVFGQMRVSSDRWGESRQWRIGGGGNSRYYDGYVQGSDAGSINIVSNGGQALHRLQAGSVTGPFTRETADRPSGGQYNITLGRQYILNGSSQPVIIASDDTLQNIDQQLLEDFLVSNANAPLFNFQVSDAQINSGISAFTISTGNANVDIAEDAHIDMAAGAAFNVNALDITLDGSIHSAAGNVSLNASDNLYVNNLIDVSGRWVNDNPLLASFDASADLAIEGGSISLTAGKEVLNGDLLLTEASRLLANGGAWLQADGELRAGSGGNISITSRREINTEADIPQLLLAGRFEAFGLEQGGSLNISANRIRIATQAAANPRAGELQLTPAFFQSGGFSRYNLSSNIDDLVLASGTRLQPRTSSLLLGAGYALQQSAENLSALSYRAELPDYLRPATSLSLQGNVSAGRALAQQVRIEQGASIDLDPGASLTLASATNLFMNGDVRAPGGDVNLRLNTNNDYYFANRGIWLGGSIDVSGSFVEQPADDMGLLTGEIFDAGSVSLLARQGYIVLDENSHIDASGDAFEMDVAARVNNNNVLAWQRLPVASDAGSIELVAAEGILPMGRLDAQAAPVTGSSGGRLLVELNTRNRGSGGDVTTFTDEARVIHVVQSQQQLPGAVQQGSNLDDRFIGQAWLSTELVDAAGFDSLSLVSNNNMIRPEVGTAVVELQGGVNLHTGMSLEILSPIIRGQGVAGERVDLSAPYVHLGSPFESNPRLTDQASQGDVSLHVQAGNPGDEGLLELTGHLRLQDFSEVNLGSRGDIRLRGIQTGTEDTTLTGSLVSWGDMNLLADQLYASTISEFDLRVDGAVDGTLSIRSTGEQAAPVLSAGSQLGLQAPNIAQYGVVKAPLGEITFDAEQQLVLGENSLTSVSADDQLIPFGTTIGQEKWIYPLGEVVSTGEPIFSEIQAPPEKRIVLNGDDVSFANNAVIDLAGGGDLYAWEFVPGIGGSNDNLLSAYNQDAFAIIPGSPSFGAYDPVYWRNSNVEVGQSIYLQGSDLLAEGEYTVLPARYALLPGAYLVTPQDRQVLPGQQFTRIDGVPVVAGQPGRTGTDFHEQFWSAYAIEDGDRVRQRSEYFESTGNDFFRNAAISNEIEIPALPVDAGSLDILARSGLELAGSLNSTSNGRGSQVNIAGSNIRVVSGEKDGLGGIEILDSNLNSLQADSILLGGLRHFSEQGSVVDVTASQVSIESGVDLVVPDLILTASDRISIQSHASILATDDAGLQDRQIIIGNDTVAGSGDGALFRASSAQQLRLQRINETGARGVIDIQADSHIEAERSMVIDATNNSSLDGDLVMSGGSLNLGSSRITLGDGGDTGLLLSQSRLNSLNVDELILNSRSSIDLRGALDLDFNRLELNAYALDGYGSEEKIINASRIVLANSAHARIADTPDNQLAHAHDGSGNLQLRAGDNTTAGNVLVDSGELHIRGFQGVAAIDPADNIDAVAIYASNDLFANGNGRMIFDVDGDITLDAGRISAAAGIDYLYDAGASALHLTKSSDLAQNTDRQLAAHLSFNADSILQQGHIDLASGYLSLTAENDIVLDASLQPTDPDTHLPVHSLIDMSGIARDFAGETEYTRGGTLLLNSANGNVRVLANADVNASGGRQLSETGERSGAGNAGEILLSATQGDVLLAGNLSASHGDNARGGRLAIDANTISGLDHASLNDSGFTDGRSIRLRNGDIQLGVDETLRARDVLLAADNGRVIISGMIDASGEQGGEVRLAAADHDDNSIDIALNSNAVIDASATADNGDGGYVYMEVRDAGAMALQAGSRIDVSASGEGRGGRIHLRAPRSATNDAVQITQTAANMTGFRRLDVEAYTSYSDSIITNADLGTAAAQATAFINAVNLNFSGVDASLQDNIHIRPGIEFSSPGNMSLSSLDFVNQRFSSNGRDEAAIMSFYSTGNLTVNGNISDAFIVETDLFSGAVYDRLQAGESTSYRFVSGSDVSAAYSMSVIEGAVDTSLSSTGAAAASNEQNYLALTNGHTIRTGSGDIDIATGGRLLLGTDAAIYTAGRSDGRGGNDNIFESEVFGIPGLYAIDWGILPGAEFPIDGGNITIDAKLGIRGDGYTSTLASDWLYRISDKLYQFTTTDVIQGSMPTLRGINFSNFAHGIGALGGGDVSIHSGGDADNLIVSLPTTQKFVGEASIDASNNPIAISFVTEDTELRGGGNLNLNVAGDITNSQLQVDRGRMDVYASGDIGSSNNNQSGLSLLLGDTQSHIASDGDLVIQGVNNVGMLPFSNNQVNSFIFISALSGYSNYYSIYSSESLLDVTSLGGDITFLNNASRWRSSADSSGDLVNAGLGIYYPGSLLAHAISGDINLNQSMYLWGAPRGQLELLADNGIQASAALGSDAVVITMMDLLPSELPNEYNPIFSSANGYSGGYTGFSASNVSNRHSPQLVHANDALPVRVVANHGSIGAVQQEESLLFNLPKQAELIAAKDISEVSIYGQNLNENDITLIQAGRDISFINTQALGLATTKNNRFSFAGPGEVYILAGRNIDLGDQNGINLIGNLNNSALANKGAKATIMAGVGNGISAQQADYEGFIDSYFAYGSGYELDRLEYYESDLLAGMDGQQLSDYENAFLALSAEQQQARLQQAQNELLAMSEQQRRSFALSAFYHEIQASATRAAQEQNHSLGRNDRERYGYSRGLDVINTLFPGSVLAKGDSGQLVEGDEISLADGGSYRIQDDDIIDTGGYNYVIPEHNTAYSGNIKLISSSILSDADGSDVSIFVPGGELNVGLSVADASGNNSIKGIVSRGDGDINILAHNNVAVNQSRIQALNGGDITIWSSRGDVDAGRGAKSSQSLPPPRIVLDNNGNITQVVDPSTQGSGIRTDLSSKNNKHQLSLWRRTHRKIGNDQQPGDVYLAAVSGVIDAGDAGIAAGGNLTLATETVLNSDNIEAGGDSVGVPTESAGVAVDLGNMDASNSSGDGAAQTELVAKDASAQLGEGAVAILQVEVMGLSDDEQKAGDDNQNEAPW